MAITSGFFNSLNGDRKYDARQMGEMFDGLIEDGVFMSIGDALKTVPSSGMIVAVGTGRAWFLHTWTKNDSDHLITVSAAESVLNRIDTIVLDVDNTEATRDNDIVLVKGTPSSNPKRPILIDTDDHKQIPLADILVPAGSTTLTATNITNIVGTSECPYVTGPLSIIQNDDILKAWQEEFDTWFDGVKGTLGTDTAGQLYNLIQQKVDKTSVLDSMDEVELTTEEGFVAGALAVKELNDKISGSAGQIVYCGLVNLLYNTSTDLQGVLDDAPAEIFGNLSNYAVLLTLRNASGTPYNQVDRLTYEVRTAQRVLVLDGHGSGFVSGHVVSVSVIIVKKLWIRT